jgi:hypothetical protein
MYYQTKSLSLDGGWTTCVIVDNSNKDKWVVEYNDGESLVKKEVDPEEIKSLDYFPSELSN